MTVRFIARSFFIAKFMHISAGVLKLQWARKWDVFFEKQCSVSSHSNDDDD